MAEFLLANAGGRYAKGNVAELFDTVGRTRCAKVLVVALYLHVAPYSHVPPVAAADFEQGLGDLSQRAYPRGFHECAEYVSVALTHCLEPFQRPGRFLLVAIMKSDKSV